MLDATTCSFVILTVLPSSKYVVRYNLFYCCLTYLCNFKQIYCTLQFVLLLPNISNILTTCNVKQIRCTLQPVSYLPYRWWQSLDRFIPSALNNKDWSKGLNQKLIVYMHAFVWRYHLPVTADLKSHLGKLKLVKTKRAATADFARMTQTSCNLQDEMLSKTQMRPG